MRHAAWNFVVTLTRHNLNTSKFLSLHTLGGLGGVDNNIVVSPVTELKQDCVWDSHLCRSCRVLPRPPSCGTEHMALLYFTFGHLFLLTSFMYAVSEINYFNFRCRFRPFKYKDLQCPDCKSFQED